MGKKSFEHWLKDEINWKQIDEDLKSESKKWKRSRPWSKEEEKLIKKYYKRMPVKVLAKKLNRPVSSVERKASRLDCMGDHKNSGAHWEYNDEES